MKPKLLVPFMLVIFLAGSSLAFGQSRNEKKIDRLQRKIEKQSQKLQELTGEEYRIDTQIAPPINEEEIEKIKEEAMAQAEQAREEVKESMEIQREAMEDQREAMKDQQREMEKKVIVIRKKNAEKMAQLNELNLLGEEDSVKVVVDVLKDHNGKKYHYYLKTPNHQSGSGGVTVFGSDGDYKLNIPEFKGGAFNFFYNNQDNLSINKTLKEESGLVEFNYEVKEGSNGISLTVKGEMEAGQIEILIKRPDGEVYNKYTLSPLANVSWKQTIKLEDQKETEYVGKWTITVDADNAKGSYNVQINGL
jgi:hypothetical protein